MGSPAAAGEWFGGLEGFDMTRFRGALVGFTLTLAAGAALGASKPPVKSSDIEPEAVQAIQRMRAYLGTLTTFEVTSESSQDVVLDNGQKVQIEGAVLYRVRRPNGFEIKVTTADKVRDFIYDGRQLTVYAPQFGYFAQTPAPPTIRQVLDAATAKYGIEFPLEDLFHWSEPTTPQPTVKTAYVVGDSLISGAQTTEYAFRGRDRDWIVWIQKGDQPLPRKVTIIDRTDEARPAYTVRLNWNLKAPISDASFSFKPAKGDKKISFFASR
jgi:hypothetical protein